MNLKKVFDIVSILNMKLWIENKVINQDFYDPLVFIAINHTPRKSLHRISTFFLICVIYFNMYLIKSLRNKSRHFNFSTYSLGSYKQCLLNSMSMFSIKRPVLLNVLVWIFPQKSLWNNLVYLKFWEPQYVHENQGNLKSFEKVSI